MRAFLSPGERALLASLPFNESAVLLACFDELDARLAPEHEPLTAVQEDILPMPVSVRERADKIAP